MNTNNTIKPKTAKTKTIKPLKSSKISKSLKNIETAVFAAQLNNGIIFKKIFDSIKEIVSAINIDVSSSGINIKAMDASHIIFVSLLLQESGFDVYKTDKNFIIGLDITNLLKILKCGDNDDIITLMTEQEEPTSLRLIYENLQSEKISNFYLNLINLDIEQFDIPDLESSSIITMPTIEFGKIIQELFAISETVTIEVTKEYILFSVIGDIGSGNIKLQSHESEKKEERIILEVEEDIKMSFNLKYLSMITKAQTLTSQVILCLSKDAPLIVNFQIEKIGSLKYYLAQKIDDNEQ